MKARSPLTLLGIAGALSLIATRAMAGDPSQWKCESCPFEGKAKSGSVQVGVIGVSDDSLSFGDYTGLDHQGAYADVGGDASYRSGDGAYGSVTATDLGLDTRSIGIEYGHEGRFRLNVDYDQIPRHFYDEGQTPFLGAGGSLLSLPAGFPPPPPGTTAQMPLDSTLHEADIGYKRSSLEAGLLWIFGPQWTTHLSVRHDERNGTQRISSSFFSTAEQMAAPLDQSTDLIEASASRFGQRFQFTVAYQGSLFHNSDEGLVWANPFNPVVAGATQGQLALAPDNQFHQLMVQAGYAITPTIQASADVAAGRMTQNASYVAATQNPNLAVTLPATSLDGQVDTFNSDLRLTAALTNSFRLAASWARDVRDNRTDSLAYPAISTDMFLGATPRSNRPYDFIQDRYRASAEYRGPSGLRASIGGDEDDMERNLQEVMKTRETTLWGRVDARLVDRLSLWLKYAHSSRDNSSYGIATWVDPPQNPLMRKFYLANRDRDAVSLHADVPFGARVSLGLGAELTDDDYKDTTLGLLDGRSVSIDADLSVALSERTQVHAFGQGERTNSHQAGSEVYAQPDWWARIEDSVDVAGVGFKHLAMKNKLELSGDYTWTRARSQVTVDVIAGSPAFPENKSVRDTLKLRGAYRLKDNLTIIGEYWYEYYSSRDWQYDNVLPDTVPNLLAFGNPPPHYNENVGMLSLRWRL